MAGDTLSSRGRRYCDVVVFRAWLVPPMRYKLLQQRPRPDQDRAPAIHSGRDRRSSHLNACVRPEKIYQRHVIKSIDDSTHGTHGTHAAHAARQVELFCSKLIGRVMRKFRSNLRSVATFQLLT